MERIEVNANTGLVALGGMVVGCAAGGGVAYLLCRKSFESRLNSEVAEIKTRYNDRLKEVLSGVIGGIPEAGVPFVGRSDRDLPLAGSEAGDEDEGRAALGDDDDADDGGRDEHLESGNAVSAIEAIRRKASELRDPLEGIEGEYGDGSGDDPDGAEDDDTGDASGSLPADEGLPPAVDRNLDGPYVISLEEFVDPPPGWQQITITYYAADKVMVDERRDPIPHFQKITGPINGPQDFGGISGDPHLRYVRNLIMDTDFEIVFDAKSFAGEVLNYGQPNKER
jgi:hypothetical protein